MKEVWKDICGYERAYQISNYGVVKRTNTDKKLTPIHNPNGYLYINLYKNGKNTKKYIHRLVAEAFLENPNNYSIVNHIDGKKHNNYFENLEYCTRSENQLHAYKMGLQTKKSKQINQFDKKGNFIKKWNGQYSIERELKISNASINKCCNGKLKTAGGYIWRYE